MQIFVQRGLERNAFDGNVFSVTPPTAILRESHHTDSFSNGCGSQFLDEHIDCGIQSDPATRWRRYLTAPRRSAQRVS